MFSHLRRGDEFGILADIVGAPHANKPAFVKIVFLLATQGDRVDQDGKVVRVAAHNLNELILGAFQCFVVDPARIHLAEAEFTSLGDESAPVIGVALVVFFFVLVSDRRAVDDNAGIFESLFSLIMRFHPKVFEALPAFLIDGKPRSFLAQNQDLGAIGEKRCSLMKGNLIDAELFLKGREDTNQGLADGSGSYDMNDFGHKGSLGGIRLKTNKMDRLYYTFQRRKRKIVASGWVTTIITIGGGKTGMAQESEKVKGLLDNSFGITDRELDRVLGTALGKKADYADLYFEYRVNDGVSLEEGLVKNSSRSTANGVGVRVLKETKTGYAFTDDVTIENLELAARTAQYIAQSQEGQVPVPVGHRRPEANDLYPVKKPVTEVALGEKIALLEKMDRLARSLDPRVKNVLVSLASEQKIVLLASAEGWVVGDIQPLTRLNITCIAEDKGS